MACHKTFNFPGGATAVSCLAKCAAPFYISVEILFQCRYDLKSHAVEVEKIKQSQHTA
jgi:hypothetical protein